MGALLASREFWTLVVGVVVSVVIALVPQLASSKDVITNAVLALVGVIIVSMGAEKVAAANTSGTTKIERVDAVNADTTIAIAPSPEVKAP